MEKEISSQRQGRILVLGTNNEDQVAMVYGRLREFLDNHNLPKVRVEVVRDGVFFATAIKMNKEGEQIPANIVLVGTKARIYNGFNCITEDMDNHIETVSKTCEEVGAKMVRFRVNSETNLPEIDGKIEDICRRLNEVNGINQ